MFGYKHGKPKKIYSPEFVTMLNPHEIETIRKAVNLSLREMADYLSITYVHYRKIETGENRPGTFVLQALHKIKRNGIV